MLLLLPLCTHPGGALSWGCAGRYQADHMSSADDMTQRGLVPRVLEFLFSRINQDRKVVLLWCRAAVMIGAPRHVTPFLFLLSGCPGWPKRQVPVPCFLLGDLQREGV